MPKTPQVSNKETRERLDTTPLGRRWDDDTIIASDAPETTIRLAGQRFTISGSGRIRMA
jgi:hypothetical protein